MSYLKFNNTGVPPTPASGKTEFFVSTTTSRLNYVDSTGHTAQVGGVNGWYDVTDYGLINNGSTDNLALINTMLSSIPSGSIVYFPSGTYAFSATINPGSKYFRFIGTGYYNSILKTLSATADLFTLTDANWYTSFEDLQFTTSVNKTAGAMINTGTASSSGNVGINVRRCSFTAAGSGVYIFNGIVYNGTNSGNITVLEDSVFTNFSNYGVSLVGNTTTNSTAASLIISGTVMNGSLSVGNALAGVQVTQAGALQIDNTDIIGCVNNLLVNPATGSPVQGVFSLYVTNTYFDNSFGSCIKLTSTGNIERCKFIGCSFTVSTGSTGYSAFEISSTATILPTSIDIINCNILNTFSNSGTSNGILATGFTDINIFNNNISGWTNGIQVTPSTPNGGTKLFIKENIIAPIGNIATNTVGILLNAGSFTYGSIFINDNYISNTTNITDNSTLISTGQKVIQNNTGLLTAKPANYTSTTIPLTTITNVDSTGGLFIPSNIRPSSIRITVYATNAATIQTLTATVRFGTNNTNADTAVLTQAFTAGTAALGSGTFVFDVDIASSTLMFAALKFYNGNNAATGIAANISLFASLNAAATIVTTSNSWLGVYFSSATASAITIKSVKYEILNQ